MKTISQSLLNELLNPDGYCGYYLDLVFNQNLRDEPTDAMVNGLFFEQEVIGSTRDGLPVEIPKNTRVGKDGTYISQREKDLLIDIAYAKKIFNENNIKVDQIQIAKTTEDRHGHIDFIGTIDKRKSLFDLKWTGMSYTTWEREYKYGNTKSRFLIQARHYQSLFDEKLPFIFLIFGSGWCRFFKLEYDELEINHHKEVATFGLETFNTMEYRPTNDSKLCFNCRLRNRCEKVNNIISLETFDAD